MREVLIIDQDRLWVDLIREALAEQDVGVRVCGDGAEALQLVRTGNLDAVVLSVDLRGMSGYSICNRLKKDPALARVPLLLTSAEASEETFSQHSRLKTRAEAYLRKPFDKPALWQAVLGMWAPAPPEQKAPSTAPGEAVATSWAPAGQASHAYAAAAQPASLPAPKPRPPMGDALQDRTFPQGPSDAYGDHDDPGSTQDPGSRGAPSDAGFGQSDDEVEATKVGDPALASSTPSWRPEPSAQGAPQATAEPGREPAERRAAAGGEAEPQAEAAGPGHPEVTVVRAADPKDVAASLPRPRRAPLPRQPSRAAEAPEPPPGPAASTASAPPDASGELPNSRARIAALMSEHDAAAAAWRSRLGLAQAELSVARAEVASLRAQRDWAEQGIEEVLRLLRAPRA